MPFEILIVDDSAVFRKGVRESLEATPEWAVCGEAANGFEAVEMADKLLPQLVIIDFSMPRMSGLAAAIEILKKTPRLPILLLTLYQTRQLAQEAREAGIRVTMSKTDMHLLSAEIEAICRSEGSSPQAKAQTA